VKWHRKWTAAAAPCRNNQVSPSCLTQNPSRARAGDRLLIFRLCSFPLKSARAPAPETAASTHLFGATPMLSARPGIALFNRPDSCCELPPFLARFGVFVTDPPRPGHV
jgi:hypothetical protein